MLRLLPIIAILLVVLNNGTIVRSESPPYCGYSSNKTSTCPGDHHHVEIGYPFWIENGTAGEAGDCIRYYPGFQVNCSANGRPVINISNNLYYVLGTYRYEAGGGYLRVVDVDIDAQECPQPRRNISIDSPRFLRYYGGTVNMTFLYNCSKYPENVVQRVPCLYNSTRGPSFAFFDSEISSHQFDWYGNCEDAVVVPADNYHDNYTEALKSGFELRWEYPVNCGNCELSGGKCWANQTNITTTTPFHCNCTDGLTRLNGICFGPYHDLYYGGGIKVFAGAPTPVFATPVFAGAPAAGAPAADSLAPDSPMYYRSFDNGGLPNGLKIAIGISMGVGVLLSILVLLYRRNYPLCLFSFTR